MKTNKSFLKRIRVTKNGKLMVRAKGQNHFNAKESRATKGAKRRSVTISISMRARRRFLPGSAKKAVHQRAEA